MNVRDLFLIKKKDDSKKEPAREYVSGTLVAVSGSVDVVGRTGYSWAKEVDQDTVFQALNLTVESVDTMPVILTRPYGNVSEYEVIAPDRYRMANLGTFEGDPFLSKHAKSHQFPEGDEGNDAVLTFQAAIQLLKTLADEATLVVSVGALKYENEGVSKVFNSTTYDMATHVPSTVGYTRYALLYLDTVSGALAVTEGTAVLDLPSITAPKPTHPDKGIVSSYIKLTNGQTAILQDTHVEDIRPLLRQRPNDFNPDDSTFGPYTPITSESGWLTNDLGELIYI